MTSRDYSHRLSLPGMIIGAAVFAAAFAPPARAADKLEYNRDVRPIFAENCFACHGPDSAARKASLRLDRRDDAVKAKAFVPGQPDDSHLVERITSAMSSRLTGPA